MLIEYKNASHTCAPLPEPDLFSGIVLDDDISTLARATLALTGSPISAETLENTASLSSLEEEIDTLMGPAHREGFGARIKEMFNDIWLVRKFQSNGKFGAIQLRSYNRYYFYPCSEEATKNCCDLETGECCQNDYPDDLDFCTKGSERISNTAAESTLEIVRYVVENDLPFNQILMLDRPLVNPYLAALYGVEAEFDDHYDENEWRLATGPASTYTRGEIVEHAGLLSNPVFLARYPSSSSNVNRARARRILETMLGIDIMGLAKFEAKLGDELPDNPTMFATGCASCHALIDPIGAAFKDWTGKGNYRVDRAWEACTEENLHELCYRDQGFAQSAPPDDAGLNQLAWMGQQISEDVHFPFAIAKLIHRALVRDKVLSPPQDLSRPDYSAHLRAYLAQTAEFQRLAEVFTSAGFLIKPLIKAVITGPYYRAAHVEEPGADQLEALAYGRIGRATPLTPELLSQRIEAALGYRWTSNLWGTGTSLLESKSWYRIIYGGIDSDNITERSTDPSAAMQNIARNMAAEMACISVAQDFSYDTPSQRNLFRAIEIDTVTGTEENDAKVRDTIRYLHLRLLGESLPEESEELEATFELFQAAAAEGVAVSENATTRLDAACEARRNWLDRVNLNDLEGRTKITSDPHGTISGWIAVLTYLLSDYEFLYE